MLNPTSHHLILLIVSVVVLATFFASPFVETSISGELKIGVIDPDRVANDTILGKRMKGTLTEYLEGRQKVIDTDEKVLRELEEELRTQGPLLSADARQAKQDSYQEQVIAYQQKVDFPRTAIMRGLLFKNKGSAFENQRKLYQKSLQNRGSKK